VRVYCSPLEVEHGCLDRPPMWPWVKKAREKKREADAQGAEAKESPK
jgi:hypothetical protein